MRPIIAVLISACVLGGVGAFITAGTSERTPDIAVSERAAASGVFSLEITPTFDAVADPFALETLALLVQREGNMVMRRDDVCAAGEPLTIADVAEIVEGRNEFYIRAFPDEEALASANAVRVRVFRDGLPIAETTLWSEPGDPVEGTITVDVPKSVAPPMHKH